jgi:hypothetical protein
MSLDDPGRAIVLEICVESGELVRTTMTANTVAHSTSHASQ